MARNEVTYFHFHPVPDTANDIQRPHPCKARVALEDRQCRRLANYPRPSSHSTIFARCPSHRGVTLDWAQHNDPFVAIVDDEGSQSHLFEEASEDGEESEYNGRSPTTSRRSDSSSKGRRSSSAMGDRAQCHPSAPREVSAAILTGNRENPSASSASHVTSPTSAIRGPTYNTSMSVGGTGHTPRPSIEVSSDSYASSTGGHGSVRRSILRKPVQSSDIAMGGRVQDLISSGSPSGQQPKSFRKFGGENLFDVSDNASRPRQRATNSPRRNPRENDGDRANHRGQDRYDESIVGNPNHRERNSPPDDFHLYNHVGRKFSASMHQANEPSSSRASRPRSRSKSLSRQRSDAACRRFVAEAKENLNSLTDMHGRSTINNWLARSAETVELRHATDAHYDQDLGNQALHTGKDVVADFLDRLENNDELVAVQGSAVMTISDIVTKLCEDVRRLKVRGDSQHVGRS
jgi:hypothetical protein